MRIQINPAVLAIAFTGALAACHYAASVPAEECTNKQIGTTGVEFSPGPAPSVGTPTPMFGALVVQVFEGTPARAPIEQAFVSIAIAGTGPDSGQLALGRWTSAEGVVTAESLPPRRYAVYVSRIGYDRVWQKVTIRPAGRDTLVVLLGRLVTCLVE